MSIPTDLLKWKSANLNPDDINFSFNQNDDIFLIILSKMRNSVTKIIISRCYYTLRAKLSLHMCSNQCKINQVFLKYDWELECPVYSSLSPYLVLYDHCRRRQNNCFYSNCEKYDKAVDFVCCVHCPFVIIEDVVIVMESIRILLLFCSTCRNALCFLPQVLQESPIHSLFRCPAFRQLKHNYFLYLHDPCVWS